MVTVAGVDGYPRGWVAVLLRDGAFACALVAAHLDILAGKLADAAIIGVDMPIGLPDRWPREADRLARLFVGPRRNSVFMTPPRHVWEAETVDEARRRSVALTGQSIAAQTWALRSRIFEADEVARKDPRIREVHPEVSFAELAGHHLAFSKSTWAGQAERRRLLAGVGVELPDDLGQAGAAGADDVLDAAVVAWTAIRVAAGLARAMPDLPSVGADGHAAGIWR